MKSIKLSPLLTYLLVGFISVVYLFFLIAAPQRILVEEHGFEEQYVYLAYLLWVGPIFALWAFIAKAFMNLTEYIRSIEESKEAKGYNYIGWGVLLLIAQSIAVPCAQLLTLYFDVETGAAISYGYTYIYVGLMILYNGLFLLGAYELLKTLNMQKRILDWGIIATILLGSLALLYFHEVSHSDFLVNGYNIGFIDRIVEIDNFTYSITAVGRVVAWLFGIVGVMALVMFTQRVPGKIYRQALNNLQRGLLLLVTTAILLEVMVVMLPHPDERSTLATAVLETVTIVSVVGGFYLISRGAKGLHKLEQT